MVSAVRDCAVRHRKEFQNRASPLTWAVHAASNRIGITYQLIMECNTVIAPDPVVVRFKTWDCGRSLCGFEVSNPAGDMDDCLW